MHPAYRGPIRRLPRGRQVVRGIPFSFAGSTARRPWLLLDRDMVVDLRPAAAASHIVVAHFCDSWRDPVAGRPDDVPVGWVTPVGQPLARYTVEFASGRTIEREIRRRFEINDGIVGWGQGAFAAVPHAVEAPLDWRGPHPLPGPAGYAEPGHAGLLGILPGSWGPDQTGVADSVPSPTGDIAYWLLVIETPRDPTRTGDGIERIRMTPLADLGAGGGVVVGAVTAFRGRASPLAVQPRVALRIDGPSGAAASVSVDLGQVFRQRPAPRPRRWDRDDRLVIGWGTDRPESPDATVVDVDLAFAPDASLFVGGTSITADRLPAEGTSTVSDGITIEALPTPTQRVEVTVVDAASGRAIPARVSFRARDGRYLPPLGHRDEVNPGLNEDLGADVVIGDDTYAYVPGRFPILLPRGAVDVEVVHGFGHRPLRRTIDVGDDAMPIILPIERVEVDDAGWTAVDSHVHFISPTSALLQAQAEGVAIVNLLATQWGDHHTSVTDLPAAVVADPSGEHLVVMGSENRQNMLGHIGLLGAPSAVLPMASAGPPEARMGDALEWLMADWADAVHAQGGLAVAVHFPLPYAEVAADIVAGRIDAVEMQALTPGADGPSIREWYRFLSCGYRLPIVGGTDKMSAEIPLGAIRTYARLDGDRPVSFEGWVDAVRAGRTFVSSGSFIDLRVDGHEPGDTVFLGSGGGTLDVHATAWAAQPIIDRVELVHDGRVVAAAVGGGSERVVLSERVTVTGSGWLAARVASREHIRSAFATSMGAHSSPVYLEVDGRTPCSVEDARVIATIIDGARTWVETIAAVRSSADRTRLASSFTSAQATLAARIRDASAG